MIIKIPDSWLREYLDTEATPGEILKYLTLSGPTVEEIEKLSDDSVYTIEITPNRNDLLSVYGLAREAKAILSRYEVSANLKDLLFEKEFPQRGKNPKLPLKVEIKDNNLCPHFLAMVINNIKVSASPTFIKERLEKSGFRSLNNVVDISNYVMLETGQPLHIFDYDKIEGNLMKMRESLKGERIKTLDGVERVIPKGSIIIEDSEKIIDLCGIMGGENSQVTESTTSIVLFAQIYNPKRIRKTYRKLNLVTEAALRFEKGPDPGMVELAFKKSYGLLESHAQARAAGTLINIVNQPFVPHEVEVSISHVQDYLGVRITIEQASDYLRLLGFEVSVSEKSFQPPKIRAKVPSNRSKDIKIGEDLIEEIARIHGFQNLPEVMPSGPIPLDISDKRFHWEKIIKYYFKHASFFEVYNYSFTSAKLLNNFTLSTKEAIRLKNPLNRDLEYLRVSLLPSILKNILDNQEYATTLKLFELERIYLKSETEDLPDEIFHLSGIVYKNKPIKNITPTFLEVKGILETLFMELGIKPKFLPVSTKDFWHPGRVAKIWIKETIGFVGEIHPKIIKEFDLKGKAIGFDINFDELVKHATDIKPFSPVIEHPPLIEDISLIVNKKILSVDVQEKIVEILRIFKEFDLKPSTVHIIDVYEGKDLSKNKKSLTFRIYYLNKKRPLSRDEIKMVREEIFKELEKYFEAKIRCL